MRDKVLATIEKYNMLCAGDSVAVGVSGGKDSVALLHLLVGLRDTLALRLTVVHINHGIRGEAAREDEAFVASLAQAYGLDFTAFHFDVPREAKQRGISEETCGRELRYEAFVSIGADKIATAHTASDSAETILFHLIRGSGVQGLCGIPPVRGNIIRPLIECTADEVLGYIRTHQLQYTEDQTNQSDAYARNRIRLEIIPALERINAAAQKNILNAGAAMNSDNAYLFALAQAHILAHGCDAAALAALPEPVRARVIISLCKEHCDAVPERKHIEAIAALKEGEQVQINSGATVRVRRGNLEFPTELICAQYRFAVKPGAYPLPIGVLKAELLNCEQFENSPRNRFSFAVDYDRMKTDLICRNKRAGDRFYDDKRHVGKSMKKYLNEIAFEPEFREAFPVFTVEENIIGTLGSTPDQAYAPSETTKTVFYLYLER